MSRIDTSVDRAIHRIQTHAVSKGVEKKQAKHLAAKAMISACTDVTAMVAQDSTVSSNTKSRRKMLRGARTHFQNAERKLHYWLRKRNLTVQEMNRRLVEFNYTRCPKIFWDPITRESKRKISK